MVKNKIKVNDVSFNLDVVAANENFEAFKKATVIEDFPDAAYQKAWDESQKLKMKEPEPVKVEVEKPGSRKNKP